MVRRRQQESAQDPWQKKLLPKQLHLIQKKIRTFLCNHPEAKRPQGSRETPSSKKEKVPSSKRAKRDYQEWTKWKVPSSLQLKRISWWKTTRFSKLLNQKREMKEMKKIAFKAFKSKLKKTITNKIKSSKTTRTLVLQVFRRHQVWWKF